MKIIECVPNFSEGNNQLTFDIIKDTINKTKDVKLLNLEPDADYNRVVVTMAGGADSILAGALNEKEIYSPPTASVRGLYSLSGSITITSVPVISERSASSFTKYELCINIPPYPAKNTPLSTCKS